MFLWSKCDPGFMTPTPECWKWKIYPGGPTPPPLVENSTSFENLGGVSPSEDDKDTQPANQCVLGCVLLFLNSAWKKFMSPFAAKRPRSVLLLPAVRTNRRKLCFLVHCERREKFRFLVRFLAFWNIQTFNLPACVFGFLRKKQVRRG